MTPIREWGRNAKRRKLLKILLEAQQIETRNEADGSWVTSSEMKVRLAERGVNVDGSLPLCHPTCDCG
jgi:hypothetical protein